MSDTDFAALIEPVARHFWGEPNAKLSSKTCLRWGGQGSRSVELNGEGFWKDFETGEGGGVIKLVKHERKCSDAEAIEWLEGQNFIRKRDSARGDAPRRQDQPLSTDEPPEQESLPVEAPQAVQTAVKGYRYTDADGSPLYEVIRYHFKLPDGFWQIDQKTGNPKKTFRQRRPDGRGGHIYNLDGIGHTIYRHQEVERAIERGDVIFLPEGEKDVETLEGWELVGTTNSGGAQHWSERHAELLRGADVVILVDNDDAGRAGAEKRAMSLRGIAKRIRLLDLAEHVSGFPAKLDVTDWRDRMGGTAEQLLQIVQGLPDWRPRPPASTFGATTSMNVAGSPIVYDWLIKGLIERHGVFIIAGESQAGKSFFVKDLGMKIARGQEYGGRKVRRGVVIHVAVEDGKGTMLRQKGYRQHHGISPEADIPYVIMDPSAGQGFTLMNDDSVDRLIAEVKAWAAYYDMPVELIIIDTLSVSTEGLDEINGAEAGKVMARVNRLRDATGAAIGLVHHMNASGNRVRGHSSIVANVPNVIEIRPMMTMPTHKNQRPEPILDGQGRHKRRAVLTKNKNGLNDVKWTFVLEVVQLGHDEDGDAITTCVCGRAVDNRKDDQEERQKLSDDQKLVFDALLAAQDSAGQDMPHGTMAGPQVKRCAPQTAFVACVRKTMTFKAGEDEVEARNSEIGAFLKRTTTSLINAGYMGRDNDLKVVWWTGKSDRPRPRYQEREPEPPPPGTGIAPDVQKEIADMGDVPF